MKSLCLTLNKLIGEAEWCCSHFIIIVMIVVRAMAIGQYESGMPDTLPY